MRSRAPLVTRSAWMGPVARPVLTFVALADALLSLELWSLRGPEVRFLAMAVLDALAPVRPLAALVVAASALYVATRPKRPFQRILLGLAVGAGLLSVKSDQPVLIGVALLDCLAALLAGSLWPEQGHSSSGRVGWSLLGVAGLLGTVGIWLAVTQQRGPHMLPLFTLLMVLAFAAAMAGVALLDRNAPVPSAGRPGFVLSLYRSAACSGVSPLALMSDKRHFWAGNGQAFLAFACRAGVALALGPAIGAEGRAERLYRDFREASRTRGWRPAFYQVPEGTADQLPGTRRLLIGSEALVELDRFGLQGRAMAKLRHQVTKACRLGVQAEVLPEAHVPWDVRFLMRRLAEAAAARSPLGEMAFSVGRPGEPAEVERTVGLAFHGDRRLVGYVTWLWVPAAELVVLDEVKRGPEAPSGTVELLIAESLRQFQGRAKRASLGLAPITGSSQAAVVSFLRDALGLSGLSPGLTSFKAKFQPSWEPRYLAVERLLDLPPVLLATFLLHYPDLAHRWRSWARAASPREV